MTIYVVKGNTGMYDDFYEWNVKAFVDKRKAKRFAEKAQKWANEHKEGDPGSPDPFFQKDSAYQNTEYEVTELELV